MHEREQFEAKMREFGAYECELQSHTTPAGGVWYFKLEMQKQWEAWQAATALHQEMINSLLAVIEKKNEALESAYKHHKTTSLPLAIENYGTAALAIEAGRNTWKKLVPEAIALTPEKVRLVEVGIIKSGLVSNFNHHYVNTLSEGSKIYSIDGVKE